MSAPTDDGAWLNLVRSSMPPFWRVLAESGWPDLGGDGRVQAAIVPESPRRPFFNSVLYDDPVSMVRSIDAVAEAYAEAGIEAWTVWVPEADGRRGEALAGGRPQAGRHAQGDGDASWASCARLSRTPSSRSGRSPTTSWSPA